MLIYSQSTGMLWNDAGELMGRGYSGAPEAKNNPSKENIRNIGPIPRGLWEIGVPYDSKNVGPFAIPLFPINHDAFGRTSFLIHGDRAPPYSGTASQGCIILSRKIREKVHQLQDKHLKVIA